MTEVTYTDASGCSMTLSKIDDTGRHLTPALTAEHWNKLLDFKTNQDDVFICSYPKSGFHWMWEIIAMLRKGDATPIKDILENHIIDFVIGPDRFREVENRPSPRTFTTHRYPHELPKTALQQKCKIVYILRDPRDCCVSYYHHLYQMKALNYEGQFGDFVQLFLEGKVPFNSWTDHIKHWNDFKKRNTDVPFHTVYFDDMKKEPTREIRRLSEFLDVDANATLIDNIVKNTAFPTMKEQKESLNNPFLPYFKSGKEIMYRKGEVGDWKNWFTVAKSEEFNKYITKQLEGTDHRQLIEAGRFSCLH